MRMGASANGSTSPAEGDRETRASVLHERALRLADRAQETERPELMEVLEFGVGDATYAFETSLISEAYPASDLAPVPGAPGFVLGIVSVRGTIVSVLDLRVLLGLAEPGDTTPGTIIVLRSESMEYSLAADVIHGVRELPCEQIERSLAALAGIREEFVVGVTPERVLVLDAAAMLADPTLIVRQDVEQTADITG